LLIKFIYLSLIKFKIYHMTKKQLLLILNVYQNYYNDFNNISETDLNNIYKKVAFKDIQKNINQYLKQL